MVTSSYYYYYPSLHEVDRSSHPINVSQLEIGIYRLESGITDSLREIAKMLVPFEKKEYSRIHAWGTYDGDREFPICQIQKSEATS